MGKDCWDCLWSKCNSEVESCASYGDENGNLTKWEPAESGAPGASCKDDAGKLRLTLVPPSLVEAVACVRMFGTQKYENPESWREIEDERILDAVYRHWNAFLMGEKCDPESGLSHLWHMACNLAFLIERGL